MGLWGVKHCALEGGAEGCALGVAAGVAFSNYRRLLPLLSLSVRLCVIFRNARIFRVCVFLRCVFLNGFGLPLLFLMTLPVNLNPRSRSSAAFFLAGPSRSRVGPWADAGGAGASAALTAGQWTCVALLPVHASFAPLTPPLCLTQNLRLSASVLTLCPRRPSTSGGK